MYDERTAKLKLPLAGTGESGELEAVLGPQEILKPVTNLDRYGFSHVLAEYVGLPRPRRPFCTWVHGWIWWEETAELEDLIGPRPVPLDTSIIVATQRQRQVLLAHGYSKVVAGGLPHVYVPPQSVQRNPDALVAFVAHSAESERFDVLHSEYLDYLASARGEFEHVYVSVFALDSTDKLKSEIRRRGLRVLEGANPTDRNSMLRSRRVFEYFGHVSTNAIGSQIAYALAAGCKTAIARPMYKYDCGVFASSLHGYSKGYAERMEHVHSEAYFRSRFPKLFDNGPAAGYCDPALGLEMIGAGHKLSRQAAMDALGWTIQAQLRGYASGAFRRTHRRLRVLAGAPA